VAIVNIPPLGEEGAVAQATAPSHFWRTPIDNIRNKKSLAWFGLVPFFLFLILFLLIPAISVFAQALHDEDGSFGFSAMREAISGQNLDAYAAATAKRPRWLRNIVSSFSGVAANMGGLPLAFAFLSLLGRQGLGTKILNAFGWDLYAGDFKLGEVSGLITVYSYFNIPLMVLVTLPAIDGLKTSWREACANLGGSAWTYWRRVGLPILAPSLLGGFLLLFANSFSAYATARQLTDNSKIVPLRISFFLGGDISIGEDAVGYSLAAWMIILMGISMAAYWLLRRRAERWSNS
jgi:putative spermidine/putrescine transport system permease protein